MTSRIALLAFVLLLVPFLAPAQDGPPTYVLITDANVWDGTNDRGQRVASGVYFITLEAGGVRDSGRIVYLR